MVDVSIVLLGLPILSYYAGRIICYYSKEELVNKEKLISKILFYIPSLSIIIALLNSYSAFNWNFVVLTVLTGLVPILTPLNKITKYKYALTSIFLGLMTGSCLNCYILIISICAYFFFMANLDFYSKEKKLYKRRIIEHLIYLGFGAAASLLMLKEILFAGSASLIIVYIKDIISKKGKS